MRKEIIIWQLIVLTLGLFFIITIKIFLQNRNIINATTNRAECLINNYRESTELTAPCADILNYKNI